MRVGELPLLAWLPVLQLGADHRQGKEPDLESLKPTIREVLLFGSVAAEADDQLIGDVDLMILDYGFYSRVLRPKEDRPNDPFPDSKASELQDNLQLVLSGFMQYDGDELNKLLSFPADLHVVPYTVVTDEVLRDEIARRHCDPQFFDNVFKCMMRYDRTRKAFVPVTLDELRERLQTTASSM